MTLYQISLLKQLIDQIEKGKHIKNMDDFSLSELENEGPILKLKNETENDYSGSL